MYPKQVNFTRDELVMLDAEGAEALAAHFRNSLSQLHGRAKAILNAADAERRDLTDAERRQSKTLAEQFDGIEEKLDALTEGNAPTNIPSAGRTVAPFAPMNHGGNVYPAEYSRATPGGRRFVDMFQPQADPYGGKFKNLGDFCRAVVAGNDQRLMITNAAMSESVGTAGGFLVPEQWAWGVLDAALAQEAIRPRALVLPMNTDVLNVPGFDYADGTSAKRAGLLMTWTSEAGTMTEQAAKTRLVALTAKKATILVRLSSELLEDAGAFDTALFNAMAAATQIGLDVAFITGTGAGQPLGILNSPATITVAKETTPAQPANTVWLQNLAKMLSRLSPSSFANAVWLVHPTTLPALYTMVVVIQNVAGTENVGGSLVGAVTQSPDGSLRIFGKPVVVTEGCSALSSAGDVILADLSQYAVGLRRDLTILRSDHVYLTTDEVAFRMRLRVDGQTLAAAPTKLRDGTNTVSPFVVLGAR